MVGRPASPGRRCMGSMPSAPGGIGSERGQMRPVRRDEAGDRLRLASDRGSTPGAASPSRGSRSVSGAASIR